VIRTASSRACAPSARSMSAACSHGPGWLS
jgi:hypothetical protein